MLSQSFHSLFSVLPCRSRSQRLKIRNSTSSGRTGHDGSVISTPRQAPHSNLPAFPNGTTQTNLDGPLTPMESADPANKQSCSTALSQQSKGEMMGQPFTGSA